MTKKVYFSTLKLKQALTPITAGPFDRITLAKFAAVTDDYNGLYLDDEVAKKAGFNGILVPNTLVSATIEQAINNFTSNATVLQIDTEFQKLIWPSTRLTIQGVVIDRFKDNDIHRVVWEVWAEDNHQEITYKAKVTTLVFKNAAEEKASSSVCPIPPQAFVKEKLKTLVVPLRRLR